MIKPTIGRRVWFYPNGGIAGFTASPDQPCDAGIAYVWNDRMINISVADHNGVVTGRTSVALLQDDDTPPVAGMYCTWMDYQIAAAKKEAA